MAQHLARLLGEGANVQIALQELNRMTRDDSDIRLISDVLARTHSVLRALGLDPRDTTANEVYQALMAIAPEVDKQACFKASDWVLADIDGHIISFHPVDIVENYHHQLSLGRNTTKHGKVALGQEIYRRFRDHPQTHNPAVSRIICDGGICRRVDDILD